MKIALSIISFILSVSVLLISTFFVLGPVDKIQDLMVEKQGMTRAMNESVSDKYLVALEDFSEASHSFAQVVISLLLLKIIISIVMYILRKKEKNQFFEVESDGIVGRFMDNL